MNAPILTNHANYYQTLAPARKRSRQIELSTRITPDWTDSAERAAKARQAPGTLPYDQSFEPLPHQGSRLLQAADALRLGEEIVVNVERGSHGLSLD